MVQRSGTGKRRGKTALIGMLCFTMMRLSVRIAAGTGYPATDAQVLTVNPANIHLKSTESTLTSTIGTVSSGGTENETITNIPYGTTLAAFKAAVTPAAHATFEVYVADGITPATTLTTGNKVIVTAQDATTKTAYIVTVQAAPTIPTAPVTPTPIITPTPTVTPTFFFPVEKQ